MHCNKRNIYKLKVNKIYLTFSKIKLRLMYVLSILMCSHRHRRTEQEEDEELIEKSQMDDGVTHRFERSPPCKYLLRMS